MSKFQTENHQYQHCEGLHATELYIRNLSASVAPL